MVWICIKSSRSLVGTGVFAGCCCLRRCHFSVPDVSASVSHFSSNWFLFGLFVPYMLRGWELKRLVYSIAVEWRVSDFHSHLQTHTPHHGVLIVMMYAIDISWRVLLRGPTNREMSRCHSFFNPFDKFDFRNRGARAHAYGVWCLGRVRLPVHPISHLLAFVNRFGRLFKNKPVSTDIVCVCARLRKRKEKKMRDKPALIVCKHWISKHRNMKYQWNRGLRGSGRDVQIFSRAWYL